MTESYGIDKQRTRPRLINNTMILIEQQIQYLKIWCSTVLVANLDNKYNIWFRDMYPYQKGEQPQYPHNSISRPLIGQTGWKYYQNKGKQIHNLQILSNTYQPWETFEQYSNKQHKN